MTTTLNLPESPSAQIPAQTGVGERLRLAREQQNLSVKDAAGRLFLSPKLIEIIEAEDFAKGLPTAFMRGYMRSYARLLNFSENEVEQALTQLGLNAPSPAPLSPRLHAPLESNSENYMRWATVIIISVLVLLVVMWWTTRSNDDSVVAKELAPVSTVKVETQTPKAPDSSPVLVASPVPTTSAVTTVAAPSQPGAPIAAVPSTETTATHHAKTVLSEPGLEAHHDTH